VKQDKSRLSITTLRGETMEQTVLDSGINLANLQICRLIRLIDRDYLLDRFAAMRAAWTEAAGGDLSSVTVDLGSIFDELNDLVGGE
jgi:hypothetical protein